MSRWLDVEVGTDDIDLNTLPSNLALVDLQGDNEFKLLVGDLGRGEEGPKLKVSSTEIPHHMILLTLHRTSLFNYKSVKFLGFRNRNCNCV